MLVSVECLAWRSACAVQVVIFLSLEVLPMQCERLLKLTKSWYLKVKDETMAPARMVAFMEQHAADCDICLTDPDLNEEIGKIREIVLPESKIPKAVRMQRENNGHDEVEEEEEVGDDVDDEDVDVDVSDDDDEEPGDEDFDDEI